MWAKNIEGVGIGPISTISKWFFLATFECIYSRTTYYFLISSENKKKSLRTIVVSLCIFYHSLAWPRFRFHLSFLLSLRFPPVKMPFPPFLLHFSTHAHMTRMDVTSTSTLVHSRKSNERAMTSYRTFPSVLIAPMYRLLSPLQNRVATLLNQN